MAPDNASCHRRRCHTCSFCWSSTLLFWRDVLSCLLLLFCLLPSAGSLPVLTETQAANYLKYYGYLDSVNSVASSDRFHDPMVDLSPAIRRFQRFAGLPVTGEIDNRTLSMMSRSRCGVADTVRGVSTRKRQKRYVLASRAWSKRRLKYYFHSFPRSLPSSVVRTIMRNAVQLWTSISALSITESLQLLDADIHLKFASGHHGDNFPFDGKGGVLAHTFYPDSGTNLAGHVHFDDAETWSSNYRYGTNLLMVATHEIGHALGLGHSNVPGSVMRPFYDENVAQLRLGTDDILAIRELYSNRVTRPTRTTPPTVAPTYPPGVRLCRDASVDAAAAFNSATYFFKGTSYTVVDNGTGQPTVRTGYPRQLSADWPSLRGVDRLDAAVYVEATSDDAAHLYIFRGSRYWRYSRWPISNQLDRGYPRLIRDGFPGVPDNLRAAFVWGKHRHIYFTKGDQYYRYTRKLGVDAEYPKPMSLWRGLATESSVDAAVRTANSATYFFVGQQFYRFNDVAFNVDNRQPLSIAQHWFGCTPSK